MLQCTTFLIHIALLFFDSFMKSYLAQKPSRYPTAKLCREQLLRAIQALVAKDLPDTESSHLCCTQCIGISRGFLNPLSLALLLLAFQSAYAQSESAYVIDQLLVGVHHGIGVVDALNDLIDHMLQTCVQIDRELALAGSSVDGTASAAVDAGGGSAGSRASIRPMR